MRKSLCSSWQASQLKSVIGDTQLAAWEAAPIPQRTAPGSTADGGWVWGVFTKDATKVIVGALTSGAVKG